MKHGVIEIDGTWLGVDKLLVGFTGSTSYKGLPDFGWKLLILSPEQVAFYPIRRLLWGLYGLLAAIILIAIILAVWISRRIARPIQALTAYAQRVRPETDMPLEIIPGGHEVSELNLAFNTMLSDLNRSREHLVRAGKLAAVGEMAARLAHEVRTPLGIMRSSAELLLRRHAHEAKSKEMLEYLLTECDRIDNLVSGLLDSARPHKPEYTINDLNKILDHVIEMLHNKLELKAIKTDIVRPQAELTLECDRDQIIQVLLNLIVNAIQILPPGGHLKVTACADDTYIYIDVEDNGPGIAAGERKQILEPFVSRRAGGIGLGLAIVQEIIQGHQGVIKVDKSPLGGAAFHIRLSQKQQES